jgi:hypothetical protein
VDETKFKKLSFRKNIKGEVNLLQELRCQEVEDKAQPYVENKLQGAETRRNQWHLISQFPNVTITNTKLTHKKYAINVK